MLLALIGITPPPLWSDVSQCVRPARPLRGRGHRLLSHRPPTRPRCCPLLCCLPTLTSSPTPRSCGSRNVWISELLGGCSKCVHDPLVLSKFVAYDVVSSPKFRRLTAPMTDGNTFTGVVQLTGCSVALRQAYGSGAFGLGVALLHRRAHTQHCLRHNLRPRRGPSRVQFWSEGCAEACRDWSGHQLAELPRVFTDQTRIDHVRYAQLLSLVSSPTALLSLTV